ncbi:hypothetical protein GPECTOR_143g718 [Gonium pectorale]|uniref:Branched-chain-amino-acid aminotransferase n=1 Tax=Gonium pectorale TaxID=33097 RepID=A0A150FY23_GONPE|nr:hypothetical protein GPECTOR_143g718 [Gonium pectorale]|eukprot:KXZ42477.1 hypothetical protein GPECTOR_143g718 [Gonium pectorale]
MGGPEEAAALAEMEGLPGVLLLAAEQLISAAAAWPHVRMLALQGEGEGEGGGGGTLPAAGCEPPPRGPPSPQPSTSGSEDEMPLVPTADGHHHPHHAAAAASAAATTAASSSSRAGSAPVDWSRVRLGVDPAPTMFVAHCSEATGGVWDGGELVPYGPLSLLPAAQVLNYGQSIFEGLKAYRCDANGAVDGAGAAAPRVLLFRPRANAERFAAGAVRMAMPPVPPAMFLAALHAVVRANVQWVPPASRGSLYLRPLLLGTGPLLGLCPAPSYTFVVYAVPVGGRAKTGPALLAPSSSIDTFLEEGSGCNVFAAHGCVLTTPPAAGSILPGVTRASLLQLAEALGYVVREAPLTVGDAMRADEMFASGTAVVVQPIGSVTYRGQRAAFCRHSEAAEAPAAVAPEEEATEEEATEAAGRGDASAGSCANGGCGPSDGVGAKLPGAAAAAATLAGGAAAGLAAADGSDEASELSTSSCGSTSSEVAAATAAEGTTMPYGYCGTCTAVLTPEQRTALAAAAPSPPPGSLPDGVGPIAQRLYGLLTGIQYGRVADPFGWAETVDMDGPTEGPLHLGQLPAVAAEEEEGAGQEGAEGHEEVGQGGAAAKLRDRAAPGRARTARSVFADPNLE